MDVIKNVINVKKKELKKAEETMMVLPVIPVILEEPVMVRLIVSPFW